jgi:hypothetical protein
MAAYYFFIKIFFFFSIVRILVKFEPMQKHWLFLGILYTLGVAFISYVFLVAPSAQPDSLWQGKSVQLVEQVFNLPPWYGYRIWLGETLVLSTLYFKLLGRFDEGVVFWTLLLLGILVALF